MLYTTIHHPSIYDTSSLDSSDEGLYYTNIITILRDIYENCIILIDENHEILDAIKNYIDKWPDEYRILARRLLKQIKIKNRIVPIDSFENINKDICCNDDCKIVQDIIDCNKDAAVVLSECTSCLSTSNGEIIDVNKYQLSNFTNKKRRRSYIINYKDRTKCDYANLIFIPIFKYCNSIKIIDRLVGSHISPHPGDLKSNYKSGLEFLAECISNSGNVNAEIELYTSIKLPKPLHELNNAEKDDIRTTISNIEFFVNSLNQKYGILIKPIFKNDKTNFVHDRFIITNQIGLFIGRGFDLLDAKGEVNDNTIGLLDTYNSIDFNIRSLMDLKNGI